DLRPRLRRLDHQCQQGASGREVAARRLRLGQLLPGDGPGSSLRRLQDERLWPGVRQAARRGISQRQGGLGQDGLKSSFGRIKMAAVSAAIFYWVRYVAISA